jgi:short subunit dehydrogenase-like uncharacterized protein
VAPPDRRYDIVLFGSTGFAGRLAADYLAGHVPAGCRWALAGRSHDRLAAVRAGLAAAHPDLTDLPLVVAAADDASALGAIAEQSRVIATTIGPYQRFGEPLAAACAAAGTDYLDITGEPEFVDTVYVRHDETARRTGARLVHCCGFDSMPHDIGAYYTVQQLPEAVPITMRGYVEASARLSGGTVHSAITAFSRLRQNAAAGRARKQAEIRSGPRTARAVPGRPHAVPETGGWALPFPSIDPQIVTRSARALDRYGPQFRYSHFVSVPRVSAAAGLAVGAAGLFALAQVPPARAALLRRMPQGSGPSAEQRACSWFRVTFVGEGGGRRVVTRVSGGDPGYDETARMLGEATLALAYDDLPHTAGQVTTAAAMGQALLNRLPRAGIRFDVLETTTR